MKIYRKFNFKRKNYTNDELRIERQKITGWCGSFKGSFFVIFLLFSLQIESLTILNNVKENVSSIFFQSLKTTSNWNFLVDLFSRITRFLCYALLGNDSNPPCDEYIMGLLALQRRGNPAPLYPMANLNRILKGHSFFLDPGKRGVFSL